jgi:hypothetical protein
MLSKLREIGSIIYFRLPRSFRKFIAPAAEPFYQFIKRFLQIVLGIRQTVFLLKGKSKWGKEHLSLLFCGNEKGVDYFRHLLYSGPSSQEKLGKVFIFNIKSLLNFYVLKPNIVICTADRIFLHFLTRQRFMIMPEWVQLLLDVAKPRSEIWYLSKNQKKSLSNDYRKIRKYQYSYEISQDPADFKFFYDEMYKPYALARYAQNLILNSYNQMKLIFDKGFLLFVKRNDVYLGGILAFMDKQFLTLHSLGIKDGNFKYVQQGAMSALYYFIVHWTKEQGHRWIDFYFARPFLKDGLFVYKRKQGGEIKQSKKNNTFFGIKIANLNQSVQNFFENNPFIFWDRGKLKGLTMVGHDHAFTPRDLKTFFIPGLDTLVVISQAGITSQAYEFAARQSRDKPLLKHVDPKAFFEDLSNILRN